MTMENTDTTSDRPNKNIADGRHTFTVEKVVGKQLGSVYGYVWTLEENELLYEQVLFANEMGDLLRIFKCEEEKPGHFQWDTDQVNGLSFSVDVTHQPDKKKPEVLRQKFSNYKEEEKEDLPF